MMRILDQQRYWAFFKAYMICFVALVGLYVVIDAFSNLDEFAKRADGAVEIFLIMGRYYGTHMSQFYDRLCGVITMMAAIFTVTWMQKNNELVAILSAGVSTYRVIRPVWISAILVSLLAVVNQELIMPRLGEDLQKSHDDDGSRKVLVYSRYDSNDVLIHGKEADRRSKTILGFNTTLPVTIFGTIHEIEAKEARYVPEGNKTAPLNGGWLLRGATLKPPIDVAMLHDKLVVRLDDTKGFPLPLSKLADLSGETYFLQTDLTFDALTRSRQWYQYASTMELIRGLWDPANDAERIDISVFLHARVVRPLSSLALLFLSLPLVLGGVGRNMFINLGLSLGTSAVFYGIMFVSGYLGQHSVITPELAAWAPLIGCGTFAAFRWDAIRT